MKVLTCLIALTLGFPADFTVKKLSLSKAEFYVSNVEYLEFAPKHSLSAFMNPILKTYASTEQARWLKDAKEMQKELGKPNTQWEQDVAMAADWNTPRLVSILISRYDYSGGAHPNHGVEVMNFGFSKGKAKQLRLSDFFADGFDSSSFVSKLAIAKLKKEKGADWVQSGELKKLDARMLNRFTPSASGLKWHFNPYDVGPYVAGDFEVNLTLKELGPKFNRAMLAR